MELSKEVKIDPQNANSMSFPWVDKQKNFGRERTLCRLIYDNEKSISSSAKLGQWLLSQYILNLEQSDACDFFSPIQTKTD